MRADFHLHTHLSDGLLSPAEQAAAVAAAGLDHWAITDHDTLAGWRAVRGAPGLVPGVEATASHEGREIHVVGLGMDPDHAGLEELLAANRRLRRERIAILFARLPASRRAGLDPTMVEDGVADSIGRLHLARLLVATGRVRSINDAFERWLGDEDKADADLPSFPTVAVTAAAIHAAGGVALLAHPGMYGDEALTMVLMGQGLDGLEADHPGLGADQRMRLMAMARRHGWLQSAGSDLHFLGSRKPGMWNLADAEWAPLLARLAPAG